MKKLYQADKSVRNEILSLMESQQLAIQKREKLKNKGCSQTVKESEMSL